MGIIRQVQAGDAPTLRAIYRQYIETPVTFEYKLPSEEDWLRRVLTIAQDYPYLVYEEAGEVLGYAYANRHRQRLAYQWNAELSIYLDRTATRRGIGTALGQALLDLLRLQNIKTAYSAVTAPNPASEGLHRRLAFNQLGVYRNTGFKSGAWHDVIWFEKQINPYDRQPLPFIPLPQVDPAAVADILRHAL